MPVALTPCGMVTRDGDSIPPEWGGGGGGTMQFPPVPAPAWRLLLRSYEGPEEKRQAGGEGEEKREGRRGSRKKESCR